MSVTMSHNTVKPNDELSKFDDAIQYANSGVISVEQSMSSVDDTDDEQTVIALCGPPKAGKSNVFDILLDSFNADGIWKNDRGKFVNSGFVDNNPIAVDHVENEEDLKYLQQRFDTEPTVVAVDAPELDRVERYWSDYEKDHTKPYDAHKIKSQFERRNDHFWRSEHSDIAQEADFVIQNDNPYDEGFIVAQLEVLMDGVADDGEDDLDDMYVGEIQ